MIIGVTGGVGTGKSTILQILKDEYDAVIIIADDIAREQMMPGEASYEAVVRYFGTEILTDGTGSEIDRGRLAEIVFHDEDKRQALNHMTHPLVKEEIQSLIWQYQEEGKQMIVVETAILIEAGYLELVDELWVVYTDYDKRVERLISSRGYTKEKIDSIISRQMTDSELKEYADFVIDNSYSMEYTRYQIKQYLNSGEQA